MKDRAQSADSNFEKGREDAILNLPPLFKGGNEEDALAYSVGYKMGQSDANAEIQDDRHNDDQVGR